MKQQFKLLLLIFFLSGCTGQKKTASPKKDLLQTIDQNFIDAGAQYKLMMKRLPANRFPKTYYVQKDSLETSGSGWWCSGF